MYGFVIVGVNMDKFAIRIHQPANLSLILRRIAARRGREKRQQGYVTMDLLQDCLKDYTQNNVVFRVTSQFEGAAETTIYVRGTQAEHDYYLETAANQGLSLGQLLETAIVYCLGDEIGKGA